MEHCQKIRLSFGVLWNSQNNPRIKTVCFLLDEFCCLFILLFERIYLHIVIKQTLSNKLVKSKLSYNNDNDFIKNQQLN